MGPHPLNICKCMHLNIFRDEFSRFNRENFHCKATKSLVKIYACICIYFKRAEIYGPHKEYKFKNGLKVSCISDNEKIPISLVVGTSVAYEKLYHFAI